LEHRKYTRYCACSPNYNTAPNRTAGTNFQAAVPSLAIVYSPYQKFDCLFAPVDALKKGTLFSELHKPFFGTCDGNCLRKGG